MGTNPMHHTWPKSPPEQAWQDAGEDRGSVSSHRVESSSPYLRQPTRDEATARREAHLARLRDMYSVERHDRRRATLAWALAELGGVE